MFFKPHQNASNKVCFAFVLFVNLHFYYTFATSFVFKVFNSKNVC